MNKKIYNRPQMDIMAVEAAYSICENSVTQSFGAPTSGNPIEGV